MRFNSLKIIQLLRVRSRAGYASIYAILLSTGIVATIVGAVTQSLRATELGAGSVSAIGTEAWQAVEVQQVFRQYCVSCHNERRGTANLAFDTLDVLSPASHPDTWERSLLRCGWVRCHLAGGADLTLIPTQQWLTGLNVS